jgi:CheY-like chemotaxis protein/anti-sigma regulatory factor (Ser/Thr protein kinase)
MLSQVLRNLLTNAIKFTPSGEVRLTAAPGAEEDVVEFVVTDTGVGIPAAERERVFEEFYQVRSTHSGGVKGTGLGLPYARRLTRILGGSLSLESTVGLGTTVTVSLPVRPREARAVDRSLTVLVVDDDDTYREAVSGELRSAGMRVIQTADGRVALAAMNQHRPDIILVDLRLPEMEGAVLIDTLSGDDALRDLPVVVLTAFPEDLAGSPAEQHVGAVLEKADTAIGELPGVLRSVLARRATVDGSP